MSGVPAVCSGSENYSAACCYVIIGSMVILMALW